MNKTTRLAVPHHIMHISLSSEWVRKGYFIPHLLSQPLNGTLPQTERRHQRRAPVSMPQKNNLNVPSIFSTIITRK